MKRGRKATMLYDLYAGDEMQGKYSAAEIAGMLGCSTRVVYQAIDTDGQLRGYFLDKGVPEGFSESWNRASEILKGVIAKERQREMIGLIPCSRENCFANNDSRCNCLTNNEFKGGCPFYKPKKGEKENESGDIGSYGGACPGGGGNRIPAVPNRM